MVLRQNIQRYFELFRNRHQDIKMTKKQAPNPQQLFLSRNLFQTFSEMSQSNQKQRGDKMNLRGGYHVTQVREVFQSRYIT